MGLLTPTDEVFKMPNANMNLNSTPKGVRPNFVGLLHETLAEALARGVRIKRLPSPDFYDPHKRVRISFTMEYKTKRIEYWG